MNIPGLSVSDQQILDAVLKEKGYQLPSPQLDSVKGSSGSNLDALAALGVLEAAAPGALNNIMGVKGDPAKFVAKTGNYRIDPRGNALGDALLSGAELAGTGYGKYLNAATPMATGMQNAITGGIGRLGGATKLGGHIGRFAGSAGVLNALKAVPGLGVAGAALGAGDIVLGDDSALNKGMDTLAMGLGGGAGFLLGGPMGAAVGAGLAKTGSDAIQGIGGLLGIKSEKERRMEEALMALQSRGIA